MTAEAIPRPRTRTRDRVYPSPADSLITTPELPASDLRRRVSRLLLLRTIVVSVVLGLSLWLIAAGQEPSPAAVWLQSGIIAATYLSSIVFGVLLRVGVAPRLVARPMQAADLVVTSLLVYVTGGAQSPYTFLYALSIVAAGALSYRRGAVVVTIASIGALVAVAVIAWTHAFDVPMPVRPWEQAAADLGRTLGIHLAALTGVGALAFIFGDQLQKGAETLATTRKAAADLFTLHQDIVRSLASGLITIAPDGTVLTANDAACDILGRSVDEVANRSIDSVMPGLSTLLVEAQGELRRADLSIDDELTVGVTVSPLRDVRDQVIGRVINFTDLTELRRLELHMRRAERLATVGQLAAGVAHEIRNPLASISGSIELLRSMPETSEDDRALMTIVHREIQRLNVLIGDLLDYANPRPSQPVDIDLGILIDETLQVARGDQAFADLETTAEVAKPLPVHADPAKLRQVLWNLLNNAADAAAAGGKHVRVTGALGPRVDDEPATVQITVEDDGPGIPPEQLTRIFDPFFTTKRKGTGLGLATSHAVVAEHGGRIDIESTVGKGTKMVVTLPRGR
ncbi:MAG: PAS domain-containing protein [Deltaproteobacteria bacterium]|nr:PAS domain-containing protein [Deltaproteobacteria bacterium]